MKKFRKKFNLRLFKKGNCYNIKDLCRLLKISEGTVFNWQKQGLQKASNCGNYLIFNAEDVKQFLENRQNKNKQKCCYDEFFCLKCKKPRKPFGNMVDLVQINQKISALKSICEVCFCKINKRVSNRKISQQTFDITKLCVISLLVTINFISIYS
jgi:hypothetical protein